MKKLSDFFFHDLKLKNKFIIVNLILVIVPTLVLATVMYQNLSTIITSNAIESETALVNQTADTIYESVNRITGSMDNITSSKVLSILTYSNDFARYLKTASTSSDAINFFAGINASIDGEFITAIKIYLPDNEETGMSREFIDEYYPKNEIFGLESDIRGGYWHGIFDGNQSINSLFCPEFYLTGNEKKLYGDSAYIRRFENKSNLQAESIYIAIYFNREYLNGMLTHNLTGTGSVYYIINERNALVASSDIALSGMYMMRYEDVPEIIDEQGVFTSGKILGTDVFLSYSDIDHTDWRMISVIPESNVTGKGAFILKKIVFLYILFLFFALLLAFSLSSNIAGRLSKIVRRMNNQKSDQTPSKITDEKGRDEIGQLVENYNDMIERINNLMEEQTVTAEKLKVSEVKALQAQINPHFLYNMLDMINWLSKAGKTTQASKAITTLSNFYKLTLSKKEIFISVGEELRHAELYAELQNMRYENKIDMIIDVPEELYEIKIPKLVFQPIVENALIHGIFELESKSGSIVITGWSEGEDVVFTVADTGVGIEKEKIPLILKGEAKGSGNNIGIYNTHLRLQLIYGEEYGLHFESEPGMGTEVEVRIKKEI